MNTGTCASCGAAIRWAKTANGRLMPVDVEPTPGGNVVLNDDGTCEVIGKNDTVPLGVPMHKSHFATCPGAGSHRKPRS